MKKDYFMYGLAVLILIEVGIEAANLYRRVGAGQADVISAVPDGVTIDLVDNPILGDQEQAAILIEFSDFECPFCIRHAASVKSRLREDYVDEGKLRYAFVNHPLPIHANAILLATAGICADEQQRFWQMHDMIFDRQPKTRIAIMSLTEELELDRLLFESCLENPTVGTRIEQDMEQAQRLDIRGTPAFALGRIDDAGVVSVETYIHGAQPFEVFVDVIDDFLES